MSSPEAGTDLPALRRRLLAEGTVTLKLKILPKSPRNELAGWLADGSLKVRVAAAPEKGRANAALCDFLAQQFDVPVRNVQLVIGASSHHKIVKITSRQAAR